MNDPEGDSLSQLFRDGEINDSNISDEFDLEQLEQLQPMSLQRTQRYESPGDSRALQQAEPIDTSDDSDVEQNFY